MKNKPFCSILGVISLLTLGYCLFAYSYLQLVLTPELAALSSNIETIGNLIIPALALVGIYHLVLFFNALKTLKGNFINSIYIVLITLSGITLLSDLTLLSDIGKEYLLFDVHGQWLMLYGFTVLHILIAVWGFVYLIKNPADRKLFERIRAEDEKMFLSMHFIGLISAVLGFSGIIFANVQTAIPDRYITPLIVLLAGLALLPLILFVIYWVIRLKNIRIKDWLDEKQLSDAALSALFSIIVAVILYALICIMDLLGIKLDIPIWILGVFFIQLGVFSSVVIFKNS